jgi:GDPmannose 4,6-dehydratase
MAVDANVSAVRLGNIDAKRDWGHARDYVKAMHAMMQLDEPQDFVISTEQTHTVREFCNLAAAQAGVQLEWTGDGTDEVGVDPATGRTWVVIDPQFYRPADVELLLGDCTKAKSKLNWTPTTPFAELVSDMMQHDIKLAQFEKDNP